MFAGSRFFIDTSFLNCLHLRTANLLLPTSPGFNLYSMFIFTAIFFLLFKAKIIFSFFYDRGFMRFWQGLFNPAIITLHWLCLHFPTNQFLLIIPFKFWKLPLFHLWACFFLVDAKIASHVCVSS